MKDISEDKKESKAKRNFWLKKKKIENNKGSVLKAKRNFII